MTRAAIYARFSCDRQNELSVEDQYAECEKFAQQNSYDVVARFGDYATSGTSDNRPNFQQMIQAANNHEFDILIVWHTDRIHRNMINAFGTLGDLIRNGIQIRSVCQPELNDPENDSMMLLFSIYSWKDERYSKELSKNVKRGMHSKAQQGLYVGYPKYGYKVIDDHYVLDTEESLRAVEIYEEVAKYTPLKTIIDNLNNAGLRRKNNKPFTYVWLRGFISDEFNLGIYNYGDIHIEQNHEPLVDTSLWYRANEALKKYKRRDANKNYLLSKHLTCGICGKPMHGTCGTSCTGDKHYYYACMGKSTWCGTKSALKMYGLNEFIVDAIKSNLSDKNKTKNLVEMLLECEEEEERDDSSIKYAQKRVEKAQKERDAIADAIAKGCPYELIEERANINLLELKHAEEELRAAEADKSTEVTAEDIAAYFAAIAAGELSNKELIDLFVSKIVLYKDKAVIITNLSGVDHDLGAIEANLRGSTKYQMVGDTRFELVTFCL